MKIRSIVAILLVWCILLPLTAFAAEAETDSDLNQLATDYMNDIPEAAFGGMYYNEVGQLVVNVKEDSGINLAVPRSGDVVVNSVKYSLAELEEMKESLEPYMQEYGIVTLDADEVNNTIAIETTQDDGEINTLIGSMDNIDSSIVVITILPDSYALEYSVGYCENVGDLDIPEDFAEMYEDEGNERAVGASVTIYPGMQIYIQNSMGYTPMTAGPRYNSSTFCTAGHGVGDISAASVYSGANSKLGTVSSYYVGASGDHCFVRAGGVGVLPSANTLYAQTGKYTISPSGIVGTAVEMWGGVSGITSGKITATNVSVTIDNVTVRGLSRASYTCQGGDSGAAVFSSGVATDSAGICYGIQSIGANKDSNDVYQINYFSPLA